jgi:hypothetical protein
LVNTAVTFAMRRRNLVTIVRDVLRIQLEKRCTVIAIDIHLSNLIIILINKIKLSLYLIN